MDGAIAGVRADDPKASRRALDAWVRALACKQQLDADPTATLHRFVAEAADRDGERLALLGEHERLTYRGLVDRAGGYARWTLDAGLAAGEVVALLMPNCPDYVAIWLGISQAGCAVALVNTNLVADALAHSIAVAGARHVVVAGSLLPALMAIAHRLPEGARIWVHGEDHARFPRIDRHAAHGRAEAVVVPPARQPSGRDRALLIYTSGTTGAPKAANVSHVRVLEWSGWFAAMMDAQPEDRLYDCLPMYHSTGGVVAVGAMLMRGASVVIRPRFSASRFWRDVVAEDCTIFQYIGELCRYLARSAPDPLETTHRLRLCCGNGLRGDVWRDFQRRFRIPRILEFYAATEGSVSLYNCEGMPGAIGRIPPFLAHRFPVALIRCDVETGEPLRDAAGFCQRCAPDEPGEAIGPILAGSTSAARQFDGYTDAAASARKVLRDVFAPGDRWFRTGDLMRKDKAGYYYFVDRLGDTFRWKGENVSTAEVGAVVAACPGVVDAVVYGVAVPGSEGRAGMAAIATDDSFSLAVLRAHLAANLPEYARPLFVRLCRRIDSTGTFKLVKGPLAREGFRPSSDAVWYDDKASGRFVACDAAFRDAFHGGGLPQSVRNITRASV